MSLDWLAPIFDFETPILNGYSILPLSSMLKLNLCFCRSLAQTSYLWRFARSLEDSESRCWTRSAKKTPCRPHPTRAAEPQLRGAMAQKFPWVWSRHLGPLWNSSPSWNVGPWIGMHLTIYGEVRMRSWKQLSRLSGMITWFPRQVTDHSSDWVMKQHCIPWNSRGAAPARCFDMFCLLFFRQ